MAGMHRGTTKRHRTAPCHSCMATRKEEGGRCHAGRVASSLLLTLSSRPRAVVHLYRTVLACTATHLQDEYMVSNTELREKYKTAEEYEDDFM